MNDKNILLEPAQKMHFESVNSSHKDIIMAWFNKDHIKEFYYGEGLQNTLRNLELYYQGINNNGRYTFDYWAAFYDKTPFGFLITSPLTGPYDSNDDYNKWYVEGKRIFTLDLLIGETDFLGKGLGHIMIKQFIHAQYPDADFFIIDPEAANTKAIHVYEKAGFKKIGELCPTFNPKPHIMMKLCVNDRDDEIKGLVTAPMTDFPGKKVIELYQEFESQGIPIWLDGGWGVDALLGKQTRHHKDLDIIIEEKYLDTLMKILSNQLFKKIKSEDTTAWNFVLKNTEGYLIDIHVITFDQEGVGIYGPAEKGLFYPAESFLGFGVINDVKIRCLTADYQLVSHSGYTLQDKDYHDISKLHELLNFQCK